MRVLILITWGWRYHEMVAPLAYFTSLLYLLLVWVLFRLTNDWSYLKLFPFYAKHDILHLIFVLPQMLNLTHDWLRSFLPHVLTKIDRVSFGLLTPADLKRALEVIDD